MIKCLYLGPKLSAAACQTRDLGIFRYDFAGTAMDGEAVVVRVWLKAISRRQEVGTALCAVMQTVDHCYA